MSGALLITPQAYSAHGGVQAYSRRLAEVLSAWSSLHACPLAGVSLLDASCDSSLHRNPVHYSAFAGAGGSKPRFVKMAAVLARQMRPGVCVSAHIGIAPVAMALKTAGWLRSYVVVLHGIEAWRRVGPADRAAVRGAAAVVATTAYTAARFSECNGLRAGTVAVVPLALPDQTVEETGGDGEDPGTLRVLSVGRLAACDSYKGFDVLIEAVGRARSGGACIELGIVGDGDDRPRLEALAHSLGLEGSVTFLGAVSDESLRRAFRRCSVFALPSRAEGFGIVYLEAMRYGKPCIGGNHGGTPEVIGHGVDGFLVEHGDAAELAGRLVELWKEPELRTAMGLRARDKIERAYLFPQMRDSWFTVLDRAFGEGSLCAASLVS